jgi:hypothetical protein
MNMKTIKAKMILAIVALVLAVVPLAACSGGEEEETLIRPAPIEEVDILFAESYPVQVFVKITGGLADGCTEFKELTQERDGKTITIKVTTQRPKDMMCTQEYRLFEKNASLGSDFISGETYTVKVNDYTTTFIMQ